jgi:hypothetical protein
MSNHEDNQISKEQYDRLRSDSKLGYTRVIDILEVVINQEFTDYGKTQILKTVQHLCKQAIADIDKKESDFPF